MVSGPVVPLCEASRRAKSASLWKQSLVMQRRKQLQSDNDSGKYFSVEELFNRLPFTCMVNPYITRLVKTHLNRLRNKFRHISGQLLN